MHAVEHTKHLFQLKKSLFSPPPPCPRPAVASQTIYRTHWLILVCSVQPLCNLPLTSGIQNDLCVSDRCVTTLCMNHLYKNPLNTGKEMLTPASALWGRCNWLQETVFLLLTVFLMVEKRIVYIHFYHQLQYCCASNMVSLLLDT